METHGKFHFRAKLLKSYNTSRKSSPNRTPQKRQAVERSKNIHSSYTTEEEILSVSEKLECRPTSLTVPVSTDNETPV